MSNVGCCLFAFSICLKRFQPHIGKYISQSSRMVNCYQFSTLKSGEIHEKSSNETHTNEVKKSMVYTRTGDSGNSSLYNGERRSKTDIVFDALGTQDELGAVIGIAREHCALANNGLDEILIEVQSRIFDLGACVATPINNEQSSLSKLVYTHFPATHTLKLEKWIDEIDAQLPPLTNFVIASGGLSSTYLNHARTVCRRAERVVIPLVTMNQCDPEVSKYLNRLSDLLFVLSRRAVQIEGKTEILWKK